MHGISFGAATLTLTFTSLGAVPSAFAGDDATPAAAPVADFLLEAADGARVGLYAEDPQRHLTVLAFTAVECPIAKLLAPRLGRLEKEYRPRGVRFLGLDPNLQDQGAEIATFAKDAGIDFPILRDPLQVVTDRLGVKRTTEVFVLDSEFAIVYRGAVDDQYSIGAQKPAPTNDYLVDALESALAGETIATERTDAPGCLVGRVHADAKDADVTYFRDVAPILWKNCLDCHRPGQIGPMSFLDADETSGWAPQIAEEVGAGRMPPWHADPRWGHFKNARRLTETEKSTLALWAASGAKAGDPKASPPKPVFADSEWLIGKPDLVVELPEPQEIPAEGVLPYRYVTVDPQLAEDTWVQCVEVKPGNRAVTHHVISFVLPEGAGMAALADPEAALGGLHFAGNVPGGRPIMLPDGYGKFVPKGGRFLFQLHYTPNGKATTDRTRMALKFSRVPVTHEVKARAIVNARDLVIPPNDPSATFTKSEVIKTPARITGLMPHMHVRGKSFRFELERVNGEKSILLDVPRYDFNWQHSYALVEPIAVVPGDRITITAVYDNSSDNPNNPDPQKRVRWGDQTFEEMMVGYIALEQPVAAKKAASKPE